MISSSRIRQAIQLGDVSLANRLLGRPFRVTGEVIHGAHFGRTIGFPTANVAPAGRRCRWPTASMLRARIAGRGSSPRLAMTYVGTDRPSTPARADRNHVLDFDGDLYGQMIEVDSAAIAGRPDFPVVDALVAQLSQDETRRANSLPS